MVGRHLKPQFDIEINTTPTGGKQYRQLVYGKDIAKVQTPLQMLDCCLCGENVPHGQVKGRNVHLLFRAQCNWFGETWVPVKPHAGPCCPDPPQATIKFWRDAKKRELWKWGRRNELTKDRKRREAEAHRHRRTGLRGGLVR